MRRNAWQEEGGQNNGFRDNCSFQKRVLSGNGVGGYGRSLGPVQHCIVPDALCQVAHGSVDTMGVVNQRVRSSLSGLTFIFKQSWTVVTPQKLNCKIINWPEKYDTVQKLGVSNILE